jgi:peptide deformylase
LSLLKLRIIPDPILREKAKKVRAVDKFILELVENMLETMPHENGVGLAANQVGTLNKVAVIQTPEMEEALVLINPVVLERLGERIVEEGCLSIPGYRGELIRSETVKVRAQNARGKRYTIKAGGLLAQALEHETDHLEGILYIDHLESKDKLYKVDTDPTDVEE